MESEGFVLFLFFSGFFDCVVCRRKHSPPEAGPIVGGGVGGGTASPVRSSSPGPKARADPALYMSAGPEFNGVLVWVDGI